MLNKLRKRQIIVSLNRVYFRSSSWQVFWGFMTTPLLINPSSSLEWVSPWKAIKSKMKDASLTNIQELTTRLQEVTKHHLCWYFKFKVFLNKSDLLSEQKILLNMSNCNRAIWTLFKCCFLLCVSCFFSVRSHNCRVVLGVDDSYFALSSQTQTLDGITKGLYTLEEPISFYCMILGWVPRISF